MKQIIAVIFGGRSSEHQVSVNSAATIVSAIDRNLFKIGTIGISKDGQFIPNVDPTALACTNHPVTFNAPSLQPGEDIVLGDNWLSLLQRADVVFPVLHGPYGEDGSFQGLLDILQLPYVGSGVLGSAICMDKVVTKQLLVQAGLPVVEYVDFTELNWQQEQASIVQRVQEMGWPVFVKPANLGSSVGISKVTNAAQLPIAIRTALAYDRKVVVERGINGRELEISVLGNDDLQISLPGEIIPSREFYDYQAKYIDDSSRLIIPADLPDSIVREIQGLAVRAFEVLNCRGMARIDFFMEHGTDNIYINEVNTIPGFTRISMYPKLWEHSGLSLTQLVTRLCRLAIEESTARRRLKV